MAIKAVQAVINGQTHTLTLNESTGKYEATLTAPSDSSYPLDGGFYPVTVNVEDTAGNKASVDSTHPTLGDSLKLFVKEQVKPTVQITSPSSGAYVTTGQPTITFKILDNANGQTSGYSGIDTSTCIVKINGTVVTGTSFESISGGYTGTITPGTVIPDGNCTVTVDVKDNDGNAAETATCTFKIDTLAPSLTVDSPADNFETNKASLTVSGTTDDATSKPVTVKIKVNGVDQGTITLDSAGDFSKTVALTQKTNTIVVTATDSAGKTTSVTRTVIYNTTAPVIKSVVINPSHVNAGNTYTISVEVE